MFELALWVLGTVGFTVGLKRGIAEFWLRRACKSLVKGREQLRNDRYELVPLTELEAHVPAQLDRHPAGAALLAAGYRCLGDRRRVSSTEEIYRFFVSPSQTIVAYFLASNPRSLYLESMTASSAFITSYGNGRYVAMPEYHRHQWVAPTVGVGALIPQHEKWLSYIRAMTDKPEELLRLDTLDEVADRFAVQWKRLIQWRNAIEDDELLTMDLKAMLLNAYESAGPRFRRYLSVRPPAARVNPARTRA